MIGVDTNSLVRLFVNDDDVQHEAALRFFHERSATSPVFLSVVVLAEFAWVLANIYKMPKGEILHLLSILTQPVDAVVDRREAVLSSIEAAKEGRGDFADLLIASLGRDAGADHTVTFDRQAARKIPAMTLLT